MIKLNILERLLLLGLLPAEGDVHLIRLVMDLRRRIGFTDEEITRWRIEKVSGTDQLRWTAKPGDATEIELIFNQSERGVIKEALSKLNQQRHLTENHVSLYEKFVEGVLSNGAH